MNSNALIIILVVVALYTWYSYNTLVTLRNKREQSFADIDTQLKLRSDLIPNLVEIVRWYMTHERETLESVTKARTAFLNASNTDEKIESWNMITSALKSLFAVSESYPDLKANTNFLNLQEQLNVVENNLAASRRFFNNTTTEYNTYLETFPSNIVWKVFWFNRAILFEIDNREELEKAPKISFN